MQQKPTQSRGNLRPDRSKTLNFWSKESTHERLKEFAREHGLSVSNVVNRAVKRFLDDPGSLNGN